MQLNNKFNMPNPALGFLSTADVTSNQEILYKPSFKEKPLVVLSPLQGRLGPQVSC